MGILPWLITGRTGIKTQVSVFRLQCLWSLSEWRLYRVFSSAVFFKEGWVESPTLYFENTLMKENVCLPYPSTGVFLSLWVELLFRDKMQWVLLRRKDIVGSPWDDTTDRNGSICLLWIISGEESVKTFVPLKIKLTPVNGGRGLICSGCSWSPTWASPQIRTKVSRSTSCRHPSLGHWTNTYWTSIHLSQ